MKAGLILGIQREFNFREANFTCQLNTEIRILQRHLDMSLKLKRGLDDIYKIGSQNRKI